MFICRKEVHAAIDNSLFQWWCHTGITFLNHAKFLFGSNHPLLTQDYDPAFFKRAITVPFQYGVALEAQDPYLLQKLNGERNASVFDAVQA